MPILELDAVDHSAIEGIYGNSRRIFPPRFAYLHPRAATWFVKLLDYKGGPVLSDAYRTCLGSYNARYPKDRWLPRSGVKPPAHSAHNFGLAIDVAVDRTLKKFGLGRKAELDALMRDHGWVCHRKDGKRGSEDWHYNFLHVPPYSPLEHPAERTTAPAIERAILDMYGRSWLGDWDVGKLQVYLSSAGYYDGQMDAIPGPLTTAGIKAFQRRWRLTVDGIAGRNTKRLLWLLSQEARRF